MSGLLSNATGVLGDRYHTVVVGSGYGGAITAARLAESGRKVCIFERGKEWPIGNFPDHFTSLAKNVRSKKNPLGLIDYYLCKDIDVLKGSGLGGTSLVNANVAIRPDQELFDDPRWPRRYRDLGASGEIWQCYEKAEKMLGVGPHPRWQQLTKVQRMKQQADRLTDAEFGPLNLTVSFTEGTNLAGVHQKTCIDCGDCFTGCNVGAKNTLYMNYLPYARARGAEIFTQIEVRSVKARPEGGWDVCYRHNVEHQTGAEERRLHAQNVILSAGAIGSTEILLRSTAEGLKTSPRLGAGLTGNGDYLGLAYNTDYRTDVMGFGNHPDSVRAQVAPGPTIVSAIRYDRSKPLAQRLTVQDFPLVPSALVDTFRLTLPALAATGQDTDHSLQDKVHELARVGQDILGWNPNGALNHSLVYLVMAFDDAQGRLSLNAKGQVEIEWPSVRTDPVFEHIAETLRGHARTLGGTYVHLDRVNPWKGQGNLITAHPLGTCNLGEDADRGATDPYGRVFDGEGGVHAGLYVVDGAIVPMPLGVNPFLTISALAEHIASTLPGTLVA